MKGQLAMASTCEKCQGTGERTATTRNFPYEGQDLHCLAFVSSCTVCGHRWEDEAYEAENSRQIGQARRVASSRPLMSGDAGSSTASKS